MRTSSTKVIALFILLIALAVGGVERGAYPTELADWSGAISALAEKVKPCVVNLSTTRVLAGRPFFGPFEGDPFFERFFERFFPDMPEPTFKTRSLGSGFAISEDGYIITNNHVIEKATEIKVILSDEKQYDAQVVGRDTNTDIALIKISPDEPLHVAELGNSDELMVGEWVVAIGNPFGLQHTVTAGIVSAKGRWIGSGPYDDFIQTDASINPGNSGGPLFNLKGEVVGINTAIVASGQGIGFAIPINMAKELLPQLKEKGSVTRGWLGVSIQEITPELAESFDLEPNQKGALVAEVFDNSPAKAAGIERGDVILKFDGKQVEDPKSLSRIVAATQVGKEAQVEVLRDKKPLVLTVKVGELKEEFLVTGGRGEETSKTLGLTVQNITPDIAQSLGLEAREGVVISDVESGSPAAEAGLRRGDVIVEANRRPVADIDDFNNAMQTGKETHLFLIQRQDNTFYVAIKAG